MKTRAHFIFLSLQFETTMVIIVRTPPSLNALMNTNSDASLAIFGFHVIKWGLQNHNYGWCRPNFKVLICISDTKIFSMAPYYSRPNSCTHKIKHEIQLMIMKYFRDKQELDIVSTMPISGFFWEFLENFLTTSAKWVQFTKVLKKFPKVPQDFVVKCQKLSSKQKHNFCC